MNVNPSDKDVRQGYSLAPGATTQQSAAASQRSTEQDGPATTAQADQYSKDVAAAADKTLAKEAAQKLDEKLAATDTGLKIRVLDDNNSTVQVEIVDVQSKKVLRKIPQDDMVKLAASIKEMTGVFVDKPA